MYLIPFGWLIDSEYVARMRTKHRTVRARTMAINAALAGRQFMDGKKSDNIAIDMYTLWLFSNWWKNVNCLMDFFAASGVKKAAKPFGMYAI